MLDQLLLLLNPIIVYQLMGRLMPMLLTKFIQSKEDNSTNLPNPSLYGRLPTYTPENLIGQEFLDLPTEDGTQNRIRIIKAIADHRERLETHPEKVKVN
jgi:hypothetical protein